MRSTVIFESPTTFGARIWTNRICIPAATVRHSDADCAGDSRCAPTRTRTTPAAYSCRHRGHSIYSVLSKGQPNAAGGTENMFHKDLLLHKRILITGGGTGLGKGMASRFLELGATVYICGRRQPVLEATASELQSKGPIHALPCDVRHLDSVEQMTQAIWNDGPLDILINNAAGNFIARSEDLSPNGW